MNRLKAWRKRVFARMFHNHLSDHGDMQSKTVREIKKPLLAQAVGEVLEIGAGDGATLPLYPADVRVTLLEPNPYMFDYLPNNGRRVQAVTETLPFPTGAFDTVVSFHVLCSVRDQMAALHEIRRVLRVGGKFIFLEHVAHQRSEAWLLAQKMVNPLWSLVGDGCQLTRDTGAMIRAVGFATEGIVMFEMDYPRIVRPHIQGVLLR